MESCHGLGAELSPDTVQPLSPRRKEDDYPETLAADRLGSSGHVNPAAADWDELSDDKQQSKATSL